jgi:dolichol-phosphate mannosyltransferase
MNKPSLSVVAPCYNEQEVLREFHRRMSAVCREITLDYEIVLVDDGSSDETWPLMRQLAETDSQLVLVKLSRNHGHQLALTAGLTICQGEKILIIDADLQDSPEHLPAMLKTMEQGADVVYGQRRQRAGESRFKLWTAAAFYRVLNKLSETDIPQDTGDFRLMSRRALDVLLSMPERHRFIRGMVSWLGFRQEAFLFDRDARFAGETKYPLRKMLRLAMDGLLSFSTWPLKLANILAALLGAVGLLFLLICAPIAFVRASTSSGWYAVLGVLALLSAVQMLVLGILGEYLGRVYAQTQGRPLFIIETIERGPDAPQSLDAHP